MSEGKKSNYVIELDCAPGPIRPPDLLPGVLVGTSLPIVEHSGAFFGNFTFVFEQDPTAEERKIIAERIKKLHTRGMIRYGSW